MPRIAGVAVPDNKRIEISLTYVFGVGRTRALSILAQAGVEPSIRAGSLTDQQLETIRAVIDKNHRVEGDLRREVTGNIRRLREIGSYVGTRHAKRLPAHGQRTKTNARTRRGKRVTVGSGRKPTGAKT